MILIDIDSTSVEDSSVVAAVEDSVQRENDVTGLGGFVHSSEEVGGDYRKTRLENSCLAAVENVFTKDGKDGETAKLIARRNWSNKTLSNYGSGWCRWVSFAEKFKIEVLEPSELDLVKLVLELESEGLSKSVILNTKNAVSAICGFGKRERLGSGELVKMVTNGVRRVNMDKPKYDEIWCADRMIKFLSEFKPLNLSDWNMLIVGVLKLVLLFRTSDIRALRKERIFFGNEKISFYLYEPKGLKKGQWSND